MINDCSKTIPSFIFFAFQPLLASGNPLPLPPAKKPSSSMTAAAESGSLAQNDVESFPPPANCFLPPPPLPSYLVQDLSPREEKVDKRVGKVGVYAILCETFFLVAFVARVT